MTEPYFKIEGIINLIKEQEAEKIDLVEQLQKSERKEFDSHVRLVSGERPNLPGSE